MPASNSHPSPFISYGLTKDCQRPSQTSVGGRRSRAHRGLLLRINGPAALCPSHRRVWKFLVSLWVRGDTSTPISQSGIHNERLSRTVISIPSKRTSDGTLAPMQFSNLRRAQRCAHLCTYSSFSRVSQHPLPLANSDPVSDSEDRRPSSARSPNFGFVRRATTTRHHRPRQPD